MAFKFWDFIKPKNGKTENMEVNCRIFWEASQEFQIRNLCYGVCKGLIANAMGRCEFKTYLGGKEVRGNEYYLWNIEPNVNQNSTVFIHKLIDRLYDNGEALIISTHGSGKQAKLAVADYFDPPENCPAKPNTYTGVTVGTFTYSKTFQESEVMHLVLPNPDVKKVIDGMYSCYYRMVEAAMKAYTWGRGQHWKVHVDQVAQGTEGWAASFQEMIEAQIKPFIESNGAILPEFDGYKYENVGAAGGNAASYKDVQDMVADIFDSTAKAMLIPAVLAGGKVEGTGDANSRFLTYCIDPLCDQLQEEANRKRYGLEDWKRGNYMQVDSSGIIHFDLFANAANVEKLVGSGVFTPNDILRAVGRAPINEPWADQHFMTKNMALLTEVLKPADS